MEVRTLYFYHFIFKFVITKEGKISYQLKWPSSLFTFLYQIYWYFICLTLTTYNRQEHAAIQHDKMFYDDRAMGLLMCNLPLNKIHKIC